MVNVAGRSKGCSHCRRRKLKCDGNQPTCHRCARQSLDCDGPRQIAFVTANIVQTRGEARLSKRVDSANVSRGSSRQPSPTAALSECHIDLSIAYTRSHVRPGYPVDLALRAIRPGDLSPSLSTADDRMAQCSALSFANILYGTKYGLPNLVDKGYVFHGVALKQVNDALSKSDCYLRDEVLLSIAILSLLESLVPSGPKNHLNHMMGLQRLLELRGPSRICSTMSLDLYQAVRHLVLFASLRTETRSIFADSQWKKALRFGRADFQFDEQDLYDFLADITILQADRNDLFANRFAVGRDRKSSCASLQSKSLGLLQRLQGWKMEWNAQPRNTHSEHPANDDFLPLASSYALTVYEFKNTAAVIHSMMHTTALILVLRVLQSLHVNNSDLAHHDPQRQKQGTQGGLEQLMLEERSAAIDICRCIPRYLDTCFRSQVAVEPVFHWVVSTAWSSLAGDASVEGRWISNLRRADGQTLVARAFLSQNDHRTFAKHQTLESGSSSSFLKRES